MSKKWSTQFAITHTHGSDVYYQSEKQLCIPHTHNTVSLVRTAFVYVCVSRFALVKYKPHVRLAESLVHTYIRIHICQPVRTGSYKQCKRLAAQRRLCGGTLVYLCDGLHALLPAPRPPHTTNLDSALAEAYMRVSAGLCMCVGSEARQSVKELSRRSHS